MTIILVGPPGSGKSTQADFLVRRANAAHIDVGLALRKTSELNSPLGKRIFDIMNTHMGLVSDDIVEEVLSGALASIIPEKLVVLDGAPRRESQIGIVESVLSAFDRHTDRVVSICLSEEESVERISRRWMCPKCNRPLVESIDFFSGVPVCPTCQSKLSRRKDDTEDGVRKRYQVFRADTTGVIDHYRGAGLLFEVDGLKEPEEIFSDIRSNIQLS